MSEGPRAERESGGRRRSAARLAAVQALYQLELANGAAEAVIAEFVDHRLGREPERTAYGAVDAAFFGELVQGTASRQGELDRLIDTALTPDWPLGRLESVLRAILRAGCYELLCRPEIPVRVIISEYLEVAHAFFAGKEPGLVNGVLDGLARKLRPQELGAAHRGDDAAPR